MEDIRYSELRFLQGLATRPNLASHESERFDLSPALYCQMVAMLAEDLYVRFDDPLLQKHVWLLRGEVFSAQIPASGPNPRVAIEEAIGGPAVVRASLTYRGVRRIDELRDVLKRDRVLEDFGILLSIRYLQRDLRDAVNRSADISISVIRADLDGFKLVNDTFGHDAGDEVMKAYLNSVRSAVGDFGTCYRGTGDETVSIILGQGSERAREIAEDMRRRIESSRTSYKHIDLPPVTASVGVANSPPHPRSRDLDTIADHAQRNAKKDGKNRVVVAE